MTTRLRPRPLPTSGPRAQPSESPAPARSAASDANRIVFVMRSMSCDVGWGGASGRGGGRLSPVGRQVEEAFVAEELVYALADLADHHAEDAGIGDELHRLIALGSSGVGEVGDEL